jgi:hypothetical protein
MAAAAAAFVFGIGQRKECRGERDLPRTDSSECHNATRGSRAEKAKDSIGLTFSLFLFVSLVTTFLLPSKQDWPAVQRCDVRPAVGSHATDGKPLRRLSGGY